MSSDPGRRVIINADDFGLSVANNVGIIKGHCYGVISSASLMVGGDAATEAIDLGRQHSALAIGLHITLNDTKPVLPPHLVSMLVEPNGQFPSDHLLLRTALWSSTGRRQIRAEIAAQFRSFQATGFVCDHVNSHRHIHLNLLLAQMICSEAARHRVRAMRIPWDPPADPARSLRVALLRKLLAAYGMHAPDRSIGRQWSGHQLANYLRMLPTGITELYFHPVDLSDHVYANDLPVLLDPNVKGSLAGLTVSGLQDASPKLQGAK